MAYTVNQDTTDVQGAWDELIYVVKDTTNVAEPNYRYVCQVTVGASVVMTMKQLPNNANAAVFNISDIAKAYVKQDENPFQLGSLNLDGDLSTTTVFATNSDALVTVTVDFGYEFTTTTNQPPVQVIEAGTTKTVKVVNGTFMETGSTAPLTTTAASDYKLNNTSDFFLSDAVLVGDAVIYPVTSTTVEGTTQRSFACLAFLNGDDIAVPNTNYVHVTYYNGTSLLGTGYFTNDTAQGGKAPAAGLTDGQSLIYLGIGPANLQVQALDVGLRPSANSGWTHYDVQMASSTTLAGNQKSAIYRFEKSPCIRFQTNNYQLLWWNSKGGVDSLPFTGKSVMNQDLKKVGYRTIGGNSYGATGLTGYEYEKRSNSGGKRSGRIETNTVLDLTTVEGDPEVLTPLIKSLINSERVYLYGIDTGLNQPTESAGMVQAYVTDSSMVYKKGVNEGLESYQLKVEISRRRTNA